MNNISNQSNTSNSNLQEIILFDNWLHTIQEIDIPIWFKDKLKAINQKNSLFKEKLNNSENLVICKAINKILKLLSNKVFISRLCHKLEKLDSFFNNNKHDIDCGLQLLMQQLYKIIEEIVKVKKLKIQNAKSIISNKIKEKGYLVNRIPNSFNKLLNNKLDDNIMKNFNKVVNSLPIECVDLLTNIMLLNIVNEDRINLLLTQLNKLIIRC